MLRSSSAVHRLASRTGLGLAAETAGYARCYGNTLLNRTSGQIFNLSCSVCKLYAGYNSSSIFSGFLTSHLSRTLLDSLRKGVAAGQLSPLSTKPHRTDTGKDQLGYSESRLSFLLAPRLEAEMENLDSQIETLIAIQFHVVKRNRNKTLEGFCFHCREK